jgi:hypothetical protein
MIFGSQPLLPFHLECVGFQGVPDVAPLSDRGRKEKRASRMTKKRAVRHLCCMGTPLITLLASARWLIFRFSRSSYGAADPPAASSRQIQARYKRNHHQQNGRRDSDRDQAFRHGTPLSKQWKSQKSVITILLTAGNDVTFGATVEMNSSFFQSGRQFLRERPCILLCNGRFNGGRGLTVRVGP